MTSYYLSEFSFNGNNAGNKARTDAEEIFQNNGLLEFKSRKLPPKNNEDGIYRIRRMYDLLMANYKMGSLKSKRVYIQYPPKITDRMKKSYIEMLSKNQIVYLVHDIESIRTGEMGEQLDEEIAVLDKAYAVILHNESMIKILRNHGLLAPQLLNLGVFDYLKKNPHEGNHSLENSSVTFAGNLDKSAFLHDWMASDRRYHINLYGTLANGKLEFFKNISYLGSLPPDEIAEKIEGSFGLVWDGTSIETCTGTFGNYLKVNDPHKFSLYIAAGMPVIVWKESALAELVQEKNIGICVEKLEDINNIIASMTSDEYEIIKANVTKIKSKLTKGIQLESCIKVIEVN